MLPIDFIDLLTPQLGEELDAFCTALQQPPTVSVRLNPGKPRPDLPLTTPVLWHPYGHFLAQRPVFTLDPLLHAGCYYVQEASSMFLHQVLRQYVSRDAVILDLCAAPGGKSTLISEYIGDEGLLVSNEVNRQRVFALSENIQKWGNGNTVVTHNKPADFGQRLHHLFDCIIIDAPCSGEGMFRKDPQAQQQWSTKLVDACAARQKKIITDAYDALCPGGILIYSTCTFNHEENEKIALFVKETLKADILPIKIEKEWGITENIGYHFYPHHTNTEGFYICAFRKKRGEDEFYIPTNKKKNFKKPTFEDEIQTWLKHPEQWTLTQGDRFTIAYQEIYTDLIQYLTQQLTCISIGIGVAEERGKGIAPQHTLALAKDFNQYAFNEVNLTQEQALNYLRQQSFTLIDKPFGYLLVKYHNTPLGFIKNIGNHANNLYPKEWRIRM